MSEKETWEEQSFKWYRHPIIHFPLWLLFAWFFIDFIGILPDYEACFSAGLFVLITGLWGIISKMFFLRIPILGKFIYENGYIFKANIVLLLLGILTSLCSIMFGGTAVINNFTHMALNQFN
jgi:hypothetical protein